MLEPACTTSVSYTSEQSFRTAYSAPSITYPKCPRASDLTKAAGTAECRHDEMQAHAAEG